MPEPQGLAGGRNDLMLFEFSGRKVVFEIFASNSQVSRDLRILDKTAADRKIAVVIDRDIDASVHIRFLRENPESNFPFIFIGDLFERSPSACVTKLMALIYGDDLARLRVLLRALVSKVDLSDLYRSEGIPLLFKHKSTGELEVSYERVFNTLVLNRCASMCRERSYRLEFARWFCRRELFEYVAIRMAMGVNMFLYTDFRKEKAVYADTDLADWIRFGYNFSDPRVILSLNSIAWYVEDRLLKNLHPSQKLPRKMTMLLGMCTQHFMEQGNVTVVSPAKNTKRIVLIPPTDCTTTKQKRALKKMVEVAGIESNFIDIG